MDVSRETEERLQLYAALVRKWNPRINLIAGSTLSELEHRHIADSLQLAHATEPGHGTWVDFGSGGGFPGIVLACALPADSYQFKLIESDQRKGAFLRTVIRELELKNTTVIASRIEAVEPQNAEVASARALAPLADLLAFSARHLKSGGTAYFMKGRNWREEVELAKKDWRFSVEPIPSITGSDAAILKISEVSHA
ncbi:16S rRNA (guanine(527)-N(7))-methyltransferase RsmG [Paracoccus sp. 1_MG-2023]|uniref:16S rRNA (guanine(527)-N(7))-methyltransferase RsmG n=1 Tax=unclassified Paracoccus (in: a-proteobacteria) TaxID=2688777 RepID=UPI001C096FC9|nr:MULTISPECIES: 16S rRNA (guanine(527)-N(7))-methyltransferase RsmG [unclassified Paracoccus (in: a-proteobacteria)]MBU2957244.1 16S rRNA (guanine(527)-N(7))-methyltransferase RsmG [Paracoccus sp. C2R09]MDO6669131.1 16S rRNA (guanine(527)-N(7))-methyltransferase RsmG [Paracoccus sp. 1_MG-2023]